MLLRTKIDHVFIDLITDVNEQYNLNKHKNFGYLEPVGPSL